MRFISSLFIIGLASITLTTQIAAACGGPPPPRLLAVRTNTVMADGVWTRRTFVELGARPPDAITFIGPSGARVIETAQRPTLDVRIGDYENFPVAIAGRASDAKWHSLGNNTATDATKKWVAKHGIKSQHVKLRAIPHRNFDVVQYWVSGQPHFIVRQEDREIRRAVGAPIGAVTIGSRNFVVYFTGDQVGTIVLPGGRGGAQR